MHDLLYHQGTTQRTAKRIEGVDSAVGKQSAAEQKRS